jgi:hypothetical protein
MEKQPDAKEPVPVSATSATSDSVHDGELTEVRAQRGVKADIALDFLEKQGDAPVTYTEDQYKKVLRKIDWRLMPLMFTSYMIQYMDKSVLPQAAIYGLVEDLDFTGQDYSWSM